MYIQSKCVHHVHDQMNIVGQILGPFLAVDLETSQFELCVQRQAEQQLFSDPLPKQIGCAQRLFDSKDSEKNE